MKAIVAMVLSLMLCGAYAYAQPAPDGGGPGGGPGGGRQGQGPGGGGPGGGGPGMGGPGRRGPDGGGFDGPGGGGPPGMRQVEMLRSYLDVVDHFAKVYADPTTAGVAAVVEAADVLKPRGADATIDYFNKILPEVKDATVIRAIHAQLADLYKHTGQQDKALDELHSLITGTSGGGH